MGALVQSDPLTLATAAVLCVVGVARLTRLWVYDAWPPVRWVRGRFIAWAEQTREVANPPISIDGIQRPGYTSVETTWRAGWTPLATCPFCVAPWFALASVAWAYWCGLTGPAGTVWWLTHLWLTVAYLASMLVVRDEPPES